jgi:L-threonylcarbamoyladenylate synthase
MAQETRLLAVDPAAPAPAALEEAAAIIRAGGLVAFPTETVYGLGADALASDAVARIYAAKGRPASDPVIAHLADAGDLERVAQQIPASAYALGGRFWPGPLTLVLPRNRNVPDNVTAGGPHLAVRVPDHAVALGLIRAAGTPIAAPSANLFARPSPTSAAHVLADLAGRIDLVLDGGPTRIGLESTIVDLTAHPPVILRPGGIPLEALRELLPDLQFRPQYLGPDTAMVPAPGTLLRHYAPRAPLTLYRGERDAVLGAMQAAIEAAPSAPQVGLLLAEGDVAAFRRWPVVIESLGGDEAEAAQRLFAALRALESRGVTRILARLPASDGLGLALADRLIRAANGAVVRVSPAP